jgi:hypothetical protein
MNAFWAYFWPVFGAGLVIGAVTGVLTYRLNPKSSWKRPILLGIAATIAAAALWHGPLGGADRFANRINRAANAVLVRYEMTQVQAHLHRGPLTRQILLAGPADDFQRSELVRYMDQLPGVEATTWGPGGGLPLIIEAFAVSLVGFCVGLLLAYLVALHRRHNAQWSW